METSGSQSDNLTRCIMKVDPFEGLSVSEADIVQVCEDGGL